MYEKITTLIESDRTDVDGVHGGLPPLDAQHTRVPAWAKTAVVTIIGTDGGAASATISLAGRPRTYHTPPSWANWQYIPGAAVANLFAVTGDFIQFDISDVHMWEELFWEITAEAGTWTIDCIVNYFDR